MLGSQVLEVGIGLILIFLLVSLILTAVRESIEAWMKTRATDLERAIAELLDDQKGSGARASLYKHPLVSALFQGTPKPIDFGATTFIARVTWPFRTGRNLPSYIPREAFALAVEDLVRDGTAGDRLTAAHEALSQGLGHDPARVRRGLEQLYDAAMDRASGWYKRRTQWILFWLGLAIALALNINAFTIAQHLATSETARAQMVGIAEQLQSEREAAAENTSSEAGPTGNPAPSSPSPGATGNETGDDAAADPAEAAANANAAAPDGEVPRSQAPGAAPPSGDAAETPAEAEAAATAERLNALVREVGLPIGWDQVQVQRIKQRLSERPGPGWWLEILVLALGYLIVALAATLGAPFWFDVLGKFMVIRSTVKPTEKSRDEASKDGGTGGAPQPQAAGGGRADAAGRSGRPEADRAIEAPQPVIFG